MVSQLCHSGVMMVLVWCSYGVVMVLVWYSNDGDGHGGGDSHSHCDLQTEICMPFEWCDTTVTRL
jgi:hypothetical protein